MKSIKTISLSIIICLALISCSKEKSKTVEVSGVIQKQELTTYQYGSHALGGYALSSDTIQLENYEGQNVTIIGHKVEGYPLEGMNGPKLLEVEQIY